MINRSHRCLVAVLLFLLTSASVAIEAQQKFSASELASPTVPGPISVYDNWSTYDELSDHVPLTQQLTMRELDQVLRLRRDGVRFDYFVIDAFW
ncbi:MAG: hypothetical protein WB622_08975, partial [Acidobacteriaceae bacterium]